MATIIRGGFKDNKERLVTIDIWSPLGMGEYDLNDAASPIKIAFDSINIKYEIDDLFETIIEKKMSIDFITERYFGDVLFSDRVKQVKVTVKLEDVVLFAGYIEPYTYSQDYAEKLNSFTLNCIDELGCLKYGYLYKHADWKSVTNREQPISFKEYLSMILPTNTYYDMSKRIGSASALDVLGVSQELFLGKSEDKMKDNKEALEYILKYLNLHIIQEGEDIFIFDWNTIKGKSNSQMFTNIFDNTRKYINISAVTVDKNAYNDDSTNVSVADTYNQIKLKVNMDTDDTVVSDPLDTDSLKYESNYKQLWFSDYLSYGSGSSAHSAFYSIIRQGYENGNEIYDSYDAWARRDWYFKLAYNPQWKMKWGGIDVRNWLQRDSNGNIINASRILEVMRNYRFFPYILAVGKNEDELNRNNHSRLTSDGGVKGKISTSNYIVISVNGNEDNSEEELKRIQFDIDRSSNYHSTTNTADGLLEYTGATSGQYSPTDDDTTNYLVFKGSITLNPVISKSGFYTWGGLWFTQDLMSSNRNITFQNTYDAVTNGAWAKTVYDDFLYAQQFWETTTPGTIEHQVPNKMMLMPLVGLKYSDRLEYNYSGHWDDSDRYDKFAVIECELKIGDKYLVETYPNGDKQKPVYIWRDEAHLPYVEGVKKRSFSLGFDPSIGQCIIGPEYSITNTVNGKVSDEKGMAVPIKKSDGLAGKISFKILAVINQQWNEISRRHPTLFRSTKYYDNWRNVWSHVSSIWIKDFAIKVISDNKGSDVPGQKSDLVYMSNMVQGVIKERKDEEFDIVTMPTTEELIKNGISTNISKNTCINISTKMPATTVTDYTQSVSDRPERLWVDQYWNIYNKPKTIVNTVLDDSYLKNMNIYHFNLFGDTIPLSISRNLRRCEMEISLQQI